MPTVFLIGTNHKYQRQILGAPLYEIEEFCEYLTQVVAEHKVVAIAEEMSSTALAESGLDNSVAHRVASQLGILHDLSDPSREERDRLGIQQRNDIELSGFFTGSDPDEIEAKVRRSHDIREQFWASRLKSMNAYPVLFICGAAHVNSFQEKLAALGYDVIVLIENWAPHAEA
jgi:hypothetical protein